MTKTIKGNLVLDRDTEFDEGIVVEGSIIGKDGLRYSLKVKGNIDAGDIDAWYIDARNIDAGDIAAWDIDARNIDAGDIAARNIDAGDIDAWDIDALNIAARNIDALNIAARNIAASFIVCESLKQKKGSKLVACNVITKRCGYERKEQKVQA